MCNLNQGLTLTKSRSWMDMIGWKWLYMVIDKEVIIWCVSGLKVKLYEHFIQKKKFTTFKPKKVGVVTVSNVGNLSQTVNCVSHTCCNLQSVSVKLGTQSLLILYSDNSLHVFYSTEAAKMHRNKKDVVEFVSRAGFS